MATTPGVPCAAPCPLRRRGGGRAAQLGRWRSGPARGWRAVASTRGRRMSVARAALLRPGAMTDMFAHSKKGRRRSCLSPQRRLGSRAVSGFVRKGPHRLVRPRTQGFHPCDAGSNPAGDANFFEEIVPQKDPGSCAAWVLLGPRGGEQLDGVVLGPGGLSGVAHGRDD